MECDFLDTALAEAQEGRSRVVIELVCPRDVSVEIHGALEKSKLFEEVFGREIAFRAIVSRTRALAAVPSPGSASARPKAS